MARWIVVSIACAVVSVMGCTTTSARRPNVDTGVTPGDDAGTVIPGTDTGPIIPRDIGPPRDGGPLDSDSDGIPDADEATYGTDPTNADSDGDGVSDGVEVLAGTIPTDITSTIPPTDFYVVLPYMDPEQHRNLDFTARLGRADVYFLVDTTGSMGGAIMNVKNSLRDVIVPAINGAIADAVMGVGDYRDYAETPDEPATYGDPGDWTFRSRQSMTADVTAVAAGLMMLRPGGGGDEPESGTEALWQAVSGPCADGSGFGAACFRSMSHPIIVLVTDAHLHNGPDSAYDFPSSFGLHTYSETIAAMNAQNVKVIGAAVGLLGTFVPQANLNQIAMDTGSRASDGSTTVYRAGMGRVSDTVVNGIVDLVGAARQDVSARSIDDTSVDTVDATQFITAITPAGSSRPVTSMDLTTFYGVPGGTTVSFDVTFVNNTIPQEGHPQLYKAFIEVFDVASGTALDRRNVYIVIPAIGGSVVI